MAARDGRMRSRDLGTDQANRRVIADEAIWPEHLSPAVIRFLREGLLADVEGSIRRYHFDRREIPDEEPVGAWDERPAPPGPPRWRMFGTRFVDDLHVAGGTEDGTEARSDHDVFDTRAGEWHEAAPLPEPRQEGTSGVYRGRWYCAGGNPTRNGDAKADLFVYDFADDSWSTGPSMPEGKSAAAGDMLDGRLHVVGGDTGSLSDSATGTVEHFAYDVDAQQWLTLAPLPSPRYRCAGFAYGGFLYVLGGYSDGVRTDEFLRYDPARDEWETLPPFPLALSTPDFAVVDGRLWVYGGILQDGSALPDTYTFHFLDGVWRVAPEGQAKPAPAGAFYDANNLVVNGRIHSIGGRDAEYGDAVDAHELLVAADHDHERGHDARVTRRAGGALLSDDDPAALATDPDPGESEESSRADHVHPLPEVGVAGVGNTVAVDGTSLVIEHGLEDEPQPWELAVVPLDEHAAAAAWWISDLSPSSFTLNLASAPSEPGQFAWAWTPRGQAEFDYDSALIDFADYLTGVDLLRGGQALALDGDSMASSTRTGVVWTEPGEHADVDVVAEALHSDDQRVSILVRASGGEGNETGLVLQYRSGGGRLQLAEYDGGSFTSITDVDIEEEVGPYARAFLRFRVEGSTVRGRIWRADEDEPTTWQIDHSYTGGVTGAGGIGLFTFENADIVLCDYFAVDTNGGSAPLPDETPGADQYATDFSGDTVGAEPADWTHQFADDLTFEVGEFTADGDFTRGDAPLIITPLPGWDDDLLAEWTMPWVAPAGFWAVDSGGLSIVDARWDTSDRIMLAYDQDPLDDVQRPIEIAFLAKSSTTDSNQIRLYALTGGGEGEETGYFLEALSGDWRITEYDEEHSAETITGDFAPFSANTWYWARFRLAGDLRVKVWEHGESEPETWQVVVADDSWQQGRIGLGRFNRAIQQYRWWGAANQGGTVDIPAGLDPDARPEP